MNKKIAVISGDGIGPEIVTEAVKVLTRIEEAFGHHFEYDFLLAGGSAFDQTGLPLPAETLQHCKEADSVLLGAVGGPKWDGLEKHLRPERALLDLRSVLGLYANIRPVKLMSALRSASPLKSSILEKGLDLVVVRELIGGLYFGERKTYVNSKGETEAQDLLVRKARSAALRRQPSAWPCSAARSSPPWTKPTYWTPPAFGGGSCIRSKKNIPRSNTMTCWWTIAPCS
jgi:3-isopropylmalate dehydrogenase